MISAETEAALQSLKVTLARRCYGCEHTRVDHGYYGGLRCAGYGDYGHRCLCRRFIEKEA